MTDGTSTTTVTEAMERAATPQPPPFSVALRSATWNAHASAEHSAYMEALLAGRLTRDGYAELLVQQHAVYAVLEEAAAKLAQDALAARFIAPELTRLPALEADLAFLLGAGWRARAATPNAATTTYVERLREVCFDWPGGFVAHHYTRYLGDLSGGQVIGRLVARTYGLEDGRGVAFYDFPGIGKPKAFKDAYRARLDTAPWDAQEQRQVIAEVLVAYELNTSMLADLGDTMAEHLRPGPELVAPIG
jgi:heme oxygenase